MAKIKYTDGVLARDSTDAGKVVFFASPCDLSLFEDGEWYEDSGSEPRTTEWTIAKYRKWYTLKPPLKGKKFYVEIQL